MYKSVPSLTSNCYSLTSFEAMFTWRIIITHMRGVGKKSGPNRTVCISANIFFELYFTLSGVVLYAPTTALAAAAVRQ